MWKKSIEFAIEMVDEFEYFIFRIQYIEFCNGQPIDVVDIYSLFFTSSHIVFDSLRNGIFHAFEIVIPKGIKKKVK